MTPNLILGPLLRYAGTTDATVWVETDAACAVEVTANGLSHASPTFTVEGHHYALVRLTDLEPASFYEYSVSLDGKTVWPEANAGFPPSTIKTTGQDGELGLAQRVRRVGAARGGGLRR